MELILRGAGTQKEIQMSSEAEWATKLGIEQPNRSFEYPSCGWIEGGMVFREDRITACCVAFEGGGQPKLADFTNTEKFPLDNIIRTRWQAH